MESQYVAFRFGAKITILGTGHYLAPGAGGGEFLLRQRSTFLIPFKAYSVVLIPHIGRGRFHVSPSFISATTKRQCYYMQASYIYIETYVS